MTARDRAENVTSSFAYWRRQGLRGEDLRQKLQDVIEKAIQDAVMEAMVHRVATEANIKADAELFRWMNSSPAHQAAVRLEMGNAQSLSLRAAAITARARKGEKGVAA